MHNKSKVLLWYKFGINKTASKYYQLLITQHAEHGFLTRVSKSINQSQMSGIQQMNWNVSSSPSERWMASYAAWVTDLLACQMQCAQSKHRHQFETNDRVTERRCNLLADNTR